MINQYLINVVKMYSLKRNNDLINEKRTVISYTAKIDVYKQITQK